MDGWMDGIFVVRGEDKGQSEQEESLQKASGRDELHILRKQKGDQYGPSGVFI